ncbi:metallophosphoesterase [Oceaniovalibus sp. ACAM 378]|uniref:metallophosphoesterase family protein n=1 Tax=Oceaniovalibus sp. ACAM 378 TaxID=2599923 RepID=UPI0011D374D6|nr:metallophosphoesterase [Oceaniovalibus sp. ACAM 378]TYB89471.1 metallophosphoesterase [Oceaniovalibus sp. ACAM 378]
MKVRAISDLHLASAVNRDALEALADHGDDWLIVAGDVGEKFEHQRFAFETLTRRFARVIWVPGNHDLWAIPEEPGARPMAGQERYNALVDCARSFGVITPEDPYPVFDGAGGARLIAPLFLLYDYSFRPDHVSRDEMIAWAREGNAVCADETFLAPDPWSSREAWCAHRIAVSEARLTALPPDLPTILVNHYPLRADLITIPRIPRFVPWCGTRQTEDWHRRFNASVVISGHLHTRRTDWRDGTRFEEVSLGYPRQWDQRRGIAPYLRDIWPPPMASAST